jgi:hypothetical protein
MTLTPPSVNPPPEIMPEPSLAELPSIPPDLPAPSTSFETDNHELHATIYSEFHRNLEDILPAPEPVVEPQLERLKQFLDTEWGPPAVENQLRILFAGGMPPIPVPQLWAVSRNLEIPSLVWEQTQSEKFVDENWPSIKMLLGDNTLNTEWAAQVLTILALFNIIRIIPVLGGE